MANDPYIWLEDIEGEAALAWVRERNAETAAALEGPGFRRTETAIREVLDSDERIPAVTLIGDRLYNFWRDAEHERGLWRRTTWDSYRSDDPEWETVLDLDALCATENRSWVWHGASVLRPEPGQPWRHALIDLSDGGSDSDETREFDLVDLAFIDPANGGFHRPAAKGGLSWIDAETVYAFTDTGPGSTTQSGYPRTLRRWRRGTFLEDAPIVYEGQTEDLYISGSRSHTPGFTRDFVHRSMTFYTSQTFLIHEPGTDREHLVRISVPDSALVGLHREWLLVELRDPWDMPGQQYTAGSLLVTRLDDFLAGIREFTILFSPTPTTSLAGATWTRGHLILTVLDDVRSRLRVATPPASADEPWQVRELPGLADIGTLSARAVDPVDRDDVWLTETGYLTPTTLSRLDMAEEATPQPLKAAPSFFDPTGLRVNQYFATSADGTRVPYVVVSAPERTDAPTLLYGYGGFEISLTPAYSGSLGRAWLERGGTYVVANIRGGGEYGPSWHQAALKADRHRAFEDFAAVATELVDRGITVPERLGAQGGSNGGLLIGNMLVSYPNLFGALVINVPLLDMRRYTRLLAGASWAAEYGDPDDPEQWKFIRSFSPYQLFDPGKDYPPVLFTTSTKDDRVHPGHARKMAAMMRDAGKDVTYYENIEGGHGGAANNAQAAHMAALGYTFLWERLTS